MCSDTTAGTTRALTRPNRWASDSEGGRSPRNEVDCRSGWFWSNSAKLFRPCLRIDRDLRPGGKESIQVFNGAQENVRAVRCYLGELIRALDHPLPVPQTKMWI